MIICQQREFYFFSSSLIPFISFSFLITLARPSSIMLKRSIERSHPCLACDLSGKASDFSPLSMMFSGKYFFVTSWGYSPLILVYWEFLTRMSVGFFWFGFFYFLFFLFFCIYVVIMWFFFFRLLMSWIIIIDITAELALHTWDKSHLSMEYSSFYAVLHSIC